MGRPNDRWIHGTTFRIPAPYLDAIRDASEREGVPQREIAAEIMHYRAHSLDMPDRIQYDPGDTLKAISDSTGRTNVAEAAMSIDTWLRSEGRAPVHALHPDYERWTEPIEWQS